MSFVSKTMSIYANRVNVESVDGTNVDFTCKTGKVLINGVEPQGVQAVQDCR